MRQFRTPGGSDVTIIESGDPGYEGPIEDEYEPAPGVRIRPAQPNSPYYSGPPPRQYDPRRAIEASYREAPELEAPRQQRALPAGQGGGRPERGVYDAQLVAEVERLDAEVARLAEENTALREELGELRAMRRADVVEAARQMAGEMVEEERAQAAARAQATPRHPVQARPEYTTRGVRRVIETEPGPAPGTRFDMLEVDDE